ASDHKSVQSPNYHLRSFSFPLKRNTRSGEISPVSGASASVLGGLRSRDTSGPSHSIVHYTLLQTLRAQHDESSARSFSSSLEASSRRDRAHARGRPSWWRRRR